MDLQQHDPNEINDCGYSRQVSCLVSGFYRKLSLGIHSFICGLTHGQMQSMAKTLSTVPHDEFNHKLYDILVLVVSPICF